MLDAITQAITTDDYLLDRSHFPDIDEELEPSTAHAAANSHAHDIEPGVVIFRRRTLVRKSSRPMRTPIAWCSSRFTKTLRPASTIAPLATPSAWSRLAARDRRR